jgi:hypothetical protein
MVAFESPNFFDESFVGRLIVVLDLLVPVVGQMS